MVPIFFCIFALVGSYLVFFHPKVLSHSVTELDSDTKKRWGFLATFGVSVFWIWFSSPSTLEEYIFLVLELLLILVASIDAYSKIIPNRFLILILVLFGVQFWINHSNIEFLPTVLIIVGILSFQILFEIFFKVYPFGWGDIKLALLLTLFFGMDALWIFWIAILLGGLISIYLVLHDRENKFLKIPFSPFLTLSALLFSKINFEPIILLLNAF